MLNDLKEAIGRSVTQVCTMVLDQKTVQESYTITTMYFANNPPEKNSKRLASNQKSSDQHREDKAINGKEVDV